MMFLDRQHLRQTTATAFYLDWQILVAEAHSIPSEFRQLYLVDFFVEQEWEAYGFSDF